MTLTNISRQAVLTKYAKYATLFKETNTGDTVKLLTNISRMQDALSCSGDFKEQMYRVKAMLLDNWHDSDKFDQAMHSYANSIYAYRMLDNICSVGQEGQSLIMPEHETNIQDEMRAAEAGLPSGHYVNTSSTVSESETVEGQSHWKYIVYINGMLTNYETAIFQHQLIEDEFRRAGHSKINVGLAHNKSEPIHRQLLQVLQQHYTQKNFSSYKALQEARYSLLNFSRILLPIAEIVLRKLHTNKAPLQLEDAQDLSRSYEVAELHRRFGNTVLLGHSQGNYYANKLYNLMLLRNPNAQFQHRVMSVGSPANYVEGGGNLHQNSLDRVLQFIRSTSSVDPLPSNITISGSDFLNHGLVETYMNNIGKPVLIAKTMDLFKQMEGPKVCHGLNVSSGGTKSYSHDPQLERGRLTATLNAYSAKNSMNIYNKNGNLKLATGFFSNTQTKSFNYDKGVDGNLTIVITADGSSSNDGFQLELKCPR